MRILPYKECVINTQHAPQAVCRLLKSHTAQRQAKYSDSSAIRLPFYGIVEESGFQLCRNTENTTLIPTVVGKIESSEAGSAISMAMELKSGVQGFLRVCFYAVLIFAIIALPIALYQNSFQGWFLAAVPLLMLVSMQIFIRVYFSAETQIAEQKIREILK